MNVNYDILFEKEKANAKTGAKLLLHVCCAPCATYCLTRLLDKFDVTLYYSNDNITNFEEWNKRLCEIKKLVEIVNSNKFEQEAKYPLKLVVKTFENQRFFDVAKGLEGEKEGGARCAECFNLRLGDTHLYASQEGFDYFGTTLTVSPYKNSQLLNQIGQSLQIEGIQWLPSDFKKHNGYNESVRLSNKYDIYRQHYCGCCYGLANMENE